jgi:hypothetical protein
MKEPLVLVFEGEKKKKSEKALDAQLFSKT